MMHGEWPSGYFTWTPELPDHNAKVLADKLFQAYWTALAQEVQVCYSKVPFQSRR